MDMCGNRPLRGHQTDAERNRKLAQKAHGWPALLQTALWAIGARTRHSNWLQIPWVGQMCHLGAFCCLKFCFRSLFASLISLAHPDPASRKIQVFGSETSRNDDNAAHTTASNQSRNYPVNSANLLVSVAHAIAPV